MDDLSPPASFAELPFYSAHFMDPTLWDPFVRHVVLRNGFDCRRILPGLPGTFPTFIVELANEAEQPSRASIVVKFFGTLFEGGEAFQVERAMGRLLDQLQLRIKSPAILAEGELAPGWSYLVFEHIQGVSIGQVRKELFDEDMERVAQLMGRFMHELHLASATSQPTIPLTGITMSWDPYLAFLEGQRASCISNHSRWKDLPSHLIEQLPGFIPRAEQLLDLASPPHLIHADLTADHLLGRLRLSQQAPVTLNTATREMNTTGALTLPMRNEWESLAIIDWGDSRVGNILYELVALHLDLFQADKHLLRLCLQDYGMPIFYQQDFARKALGTVLLHQFPMPAYVYAPHQEVHSLDELADRLFGI